MRIQYTLLILAGMTAAPLAGCAIYPEPLTTAELSDAASANAAHVASDQEPVTRSISLYEAMARALKYNLDFRVEMMQRSRNAACDTRGRLSWSKPLIFSPPQLW